MNQPIFCLLDPGEAALVLAQHALRKRGIEHTGKVDVTMMTGVAGGKLRSIRLEIKLPEIQGRNPAGQ